ncbi:MAG: hypothetical protein NNA25_01665 [Nitrospira sp.]|nr:hypothetical protein [Nitrospira sp.]
MKPTAVVGVLIILIPVVWVVIRLLPANHPRMSTMRMAMQSAQEATEQRHTDTFKEFESSFQAHYQSHYASSGFDYNHYRLAYKYGFDLARDQESRKVTWNLVEPQARAQWDERTLGAWNQYREAVRYGWEQGMKIQRD